MRKTSGRQRRGDEDSRKVIEFLAAAGRSRTRVPKDGSEADWRRDSHFAVVREAAHQSPAGPRCTRTAAPLLQLAEEIINGRLGGGSGSAGSGSGSVGVAAARGMMLVSSTPAVASTTSRHDNTAPRHPHASVLLAHFCNSQMCLCSSANHHHLHHHLQSWRPHAAAEERR